MATMNKKSTGTAVQNKKNTPPNTSMAGKPVMNKKNAPPATPSTYKRGGTMKGKC